MSDGGRVMGECQHGKYQDGCVDCLCAEIDRLRNRVNTLETAIRDVHEQHADDTCWMDVDLIFRAAGLPVPDRRAGDKFAMLKNCTRFIDRMCSGGDWPTYAELEAVVRDTACLDCSKGDTALVDLWYEARALAGRMPPP